MRFRNAILKSVALAKNGNAVVCPPPSCGPGCLTAIVASSSTSEAIGGGFTLLLDWAHAATETKIPATTAETNNRRLLIVLAPFA
jgi:hypothetical protein